MTLEQIIAPTEADRKAFLADCRETFRHPAGQRVLARLCEGANPLGCRFNPAAPDALSAAIEDGRREVVSLLWGYGSPTPQLPAPPPANHGQAKDRPKKA